MSYLDDLLLCMLHGSCCHRMVKIAKVIRTVTWRTHFGLPCFDTPELQIWGRSSIPIPITLSKVFNWLMCQNNQIIVENDMYKKSNNITVIPVTNKLVDIFWG